MKVIVIHFVDANSYHSLPEFKAIATDEEAAERWVQAQIDAGRCYAKNLKEAIGREFRLREVEVFE